MSVPVGLTDSERLRALLTANRSIVGELSLPAVLRRIVDAARAITSTRYAALGVIGSDGLLEEFVHSGVDADTAAAIGDLPRGRGVLGAVISDPRPIRLSDLGRDSRSVGFPPGHPPMSRFLGVPIRSREDVFGNLYLTDRTDGQEFDQEDEDLVLALAATAGIAIENARLYEQSRLRQEWLRAAGDISRDLLAVHDSDRDVLRRVVASLVRLSDADLGLILLPDDESANELMVVAAAGLVAESLRHTRFTATGLAGHAMAAAEAIEVDKGATIWADIAQLAELTPVGMVVALPLTGEQRPRGAILLVRRPGRDAFGDSDLQMATTFTGQAALALELADARTDQQRLLVLEDRDRIARDLHDHVIQRLFAIGLGVQSVAASGPEVVRPRLTEAVSELDETIRQIRTSIFALREQPVTARSVRGAALRIVNDMAATLGFRPDIDFVGPLDTVIDGGVADDIDAVLREGLTNVAKHAGASRVQVSLGVIDGRLSVRITDDGVGIDPNRPSSGLANLAARAEHYGGELAVDNTSRGGLRLEWCIPLNL